MLGEQKSEIIQRSILHSDDSKLSSSLQRQASHMHSSRSAQQMQSLAGLKRPPIDWSLKTRALFHSRLPFEVCRQAVMAPGSSGELGTLSLCNVQHWCRKICQRSYIVPKVSAKNVL